MATKCVLGYTYASGEDGLLPEKWAEKGPEKPAYAGSSGLCGRLLRAKKAMLGACVHGRVNR